jgi:hypothetical protein
MEATMVKSTVDTPYREATMSTGITVRVYSVPDAIIFRLIPKGEPEPQVPMHSMDTKTGKQERLAKEGDPEWVPYLRAHEQWQQRKMTLDTDARLVAALKDSESQPEFDFPEKVTLNDLPFFQRLAIQSGNFEFPPDPINQLALWLRSYIAPSQEDVTAIIEAANIIGGMDPELVESFRARLRRDIQAGLLGGSAVVADGPQQTVQMGEGGAESGSH